MTASAQARLLCLLALAGLAGCAVPASEEDVDRDAAFVYRVPPAERRSARSVAHRFALMALFAKVVYRKDLPDDSRKEVACQYTHAGQDPPSFGMPWSEAPRRGWRRWRNPIACEDAPDGLGYETYVHQNGSQVDMAVIAFRGTENYSRREALADWRANLMRGAQEAPQYVHAQRATLAIVQALKERWPGVRIYATGHSLGGGLAQQAGYLTRDIEAVYAFDTSPVTNLRHLRGVAQRVRNEKPRIFRVYNSGEGLTYVRDPVTREERSLATFEDFEFFFPPPRGLLAVNAHEMGLLACGLARLLPEGMADFDYPKESAMAVSSPGYADGKGAHAVCGESPSDHAAQAAPEAP